MRCCARWMRSANSLNATSALRYVCAPRSSDALAAVGMHVSMRYPVLTYVGMYFQVASNMSASGADAIPDGQVLLHLWNRLCRVWSFSADTHCNNRADLDANADVCVGGAAISVALLFDARWERGDPARGAHREGLLPLHCDLDHTKPVMFKPAMPNMLRLGSACCSFVCVRD